MTVGTLVGTECLIMNLLHSECGIFGILDGKTASESGTRVAEKLDCSDSRRVFGAVAGFSRLSVLLQASFGSPRV